MEGAELEPRWLACLNAIGVVAPLQRANSDRLRDIFSATLCR
jgi:hypothetical protein